MSDVALRAQHFNRLQHVIEIVRRFAHAHEHHLAHRAAFAREHHLGDDLGAAELAQQAVAAAHAKHTAHGTTHLRRDAQTAAWQQHAFHHQAIAQFHQQPRYVCPLSRRN